MEPMKIAMAGLMTLVAAALSPTDFPGIVYSQGKQDASKTQTKKLDEKTAKKYRKIRIQETRKKIQNIGALIKRINEKLKHRTSGQELFEQKRDLENQLRNLITLYALTDQALTEAGRLNKEVTSIKRNSKKGPRDPNRLQLANFLNARRQEYITFGTR
jgi:small-conductance mechanosensitive channel